MLSSFIQTLYVMHGTALYKIYIYVHFINTDIVYLLITLGCASWNPYTPTEEFFFNTLPETNNLFCLALYVLSVWKINTLYTHYIFQWIDVLFMKISQAISRTTGPNIGLFVFILMHFSCRFQIWTWKVTVLKFVKNLWKIVAVDSTQH